MPQEIELHTGTVAGTGIVPDSLALPHPYVIALQEDSNAVSLSNNDSLAAWQHPYGFNAQFFNQPSGEKTISIKKMYPGLEGKPIHQGIQTEVWFTPLLFLLFWGYGLVFFRKRKLLIQDMKEFFSSSSKNDVFKKDAFTDNYRTRIVLTCTGIVNISLFAFFAVSQFHREVENHILVFTLLLAATTVYVWFKIAIIKLMSYVFFDKKCSFIWRKAFYSLTRFTGILLIPVVLLLAFSSVPWKTEVVYAGLFLCSCLLIFYIFKITAFFFQDVFSLFYLILYLCTLEILPVLIFLNELINIVTMY